MSERDLGMER